MIIGEDWVWAHIGKTGGDATLQLFEVVPDLIVHADDRTERRKHHTFKERGDEALSKTLKVVNVRRLPSWQLSIVQHRARHGTAKNPEPMPIPDPEEVASSGEGDWTLNQYTDHGNIEIGRWLRMENLRDDFIDFVSGLRELTDSEIEEIRTRSTKPRGKYDHNVASFFTPEQVEQLYESNPFWRQVEESVYGDLALLS